MDSHCMFTDLTYVPLPDLLYDSSANLPLEGVNRLHQPLLVEPIHRSEFVGSLNRYFRSHREAILPAVASDLLVEVTDYILQCSPINEGVIGDPHCSCFVEWFVLDLVNSVQEGVYRDPSMKWRRLCGVNWLKQVWSTFILTDELSIRAAMIVLPPEILSPEVFATLATWSSDKLRRQSHHFPSILQRLEGRVSPTESIWAMLLSVCTALKCPRFILSTFNEWSFGSFDSEFTQVRVTGVIKHCSIEPTVFQMVVACSSFDEWDYYLRPSKYAPSITVEDRMQNLTVDIDGVHI
ncbi:hypothetical protein JAAARDRAFT_42578 [Jaapia argillacea MUCL 33604]|uniref:Uncharacterized protein n=1 Tax=Jaapia argillacea MUCL 33604 TaxID=933084 RepID=A0A067PFE0_9AGAM|nr:hypothetical protein JAAARDRAFT_42578 [Jaapia argillacea MUCL 33604]